MEDKERKKNYENVKIAYADTSRSAVRG
jgi:hypothetical protein